MNAFAFRFKSRSGDRLRRLVLLLAVPCLLAPVLDLVGAERHGLVDLGDILSDSLASCAKVVMPCSFRSLAADRADGP